MFNSFFLNAYAEDLNLIENRNMYMEGKDRYLKDLDWVSIVKSIRELKAMARIILNTHQQQILSFERDSMLPSSKLMEEKETK